jgi:hypothetical protein
MAALPSTFSYKDDKNSFDISIEYWVVIEAHIHGVNTSLRNAIRLMIGFEPDNIIFDDLSSPGQPRLSTESMNTRHNCRKHCFHRFSHL